MSNSRLGYDCEAIVRTNGSVCTRTLVGVVCLQCGTSAATPKYARHTEANVLEVGDLRLVGGAFGASAFVCRRLVRAVSASFVLSCALLCV